jgi:hypothetical protein
MDKDDLDFSLRFLKLGNRAVKKAQEENRKYGLPNVYFRNNKIIYQMPDGTVRDSYDFELKR